MRSADELPGWLAGAVGDLTGWSADLDTGVFDPAALPTLVTDIERATRMLRSLQARFAEDAVRRGSWRSGGDRSPEAWYARVVGCSIGQARRKLETRQRLDDQPDLDDQVRQGELSDEQAEHVSDAAGDDPETARALVAQAKKGSLAHLRRECERAKAAKRRREDDEARQRRMHAKRSCRTWTDDEGMACMGARLLPEAMASLLANLDPFTRQAFEEARREGRRESHDAYRADALVAMAEAATSAPPEDDTDEPAGGGSRPRPHRAPATVIALVSHEALVRGSTEPGETCELEGIGPVPVATVKAMMADAFLAAVVTDGTDIRSVAHLGRYPTERQRTALAQRDRCCVVPGCSASQGLEIDHVTGWAVTRVTTMDDLARLCKRHHRMKTTDGWQLRGPPGHWTWTHPEHEQPGPATAPTSTGPVRPPGPTSRAAHRRTDQTRLFTAGTDPPTT